MLVQRVFSGHAGAAVAVVAGVLEPAAAQGPVAAHEPAAVATASAGSDSSVVGQLAAVVDSPAASKPFEAVDAFASAAVGLYLAVAAFVDEYQQSGVEVAQQFAVADPCLVAVAAWADFAVAHWASEVVGGQPFVAGGRLAAKVDAFVAVGHVVAEAAVGVEERRSVHRPDSDLQAGQLAFEGFAHAHCLRLVPTSPSAVAQLGSVQGQEWVHQCFAFVLPVQSAVPAFGSGSAQPVHKWRLAVALARPPGLLGWPAPLVGDLVEPAELEGGQTTAELAAGLPADPRLKLFERWRDDLALALSEGTVAVELYALLHLKGYVLPACLHWLSYRREDSTAFAGVDYAPCGRGYLIWEFRTEKVDLLAASAFEDYSGVATVRTVAAVGIQQPDLQEDSNAEVASVFVALKHAAPSVVVAFVLSAPEQEPLAVASAAGRAERVGNGETPLVVNSYCTPARFGDLWTELSPDLDNH